MDYLQTKIVCTLGPGSDDEQILTKLLLNGMNVARMNFSHGDHAEHLDRLTRFREIRDRLELNTPVLLDTKGPEIRVGKFVDGKVNLINGEEFFLTPEDITGDSKGCRINYDCMYKDVVIGQTLLIDDGNIELKVERIDGKVIFCKIIVGGILTNNKSLNAPDADILLPFLNDRDILDIKFAVEHEYDFIALSFTRSAEDVSLVRNLLKEINGTRIKLIAKIENRQGVDNIMEIIDAADGIMVARGDLGVEIPLQEVPQIQKKLINLCYQAGKPVITATQMLESMIRNPRPTRAEVSDVANAIYDGTSCVMLSGETAIGKYPVESLETMVKIIRETEGSINYWKMFENLEFDFALTISNAISHATCTTAKDLKATAILTATKTGETARLISRFRPACPIIATSTEPHIVRQMMLSWGVFPILAQEASSTDILFYLTVETAKQTKLVKKGDMVVLTAGVPVGQSGTTNIVKAQIIGSN